MRSLIADMPYIPWTEITFPVHDEPAVWKSWGLRGGGLPIVESLRGAPVSPPLFGADPADGLPTLHVLEPLQDSGTGHDKEGS